MAELESVAQIMGTEPEIDKLRRELAEARKLAAALVINIGSPAHCRGCGANIFWIRHANGRSTPYDPTGANHFIACVKRDQFRKDKYARQAQE